MRPSVRRTVTAASIKTLSLEGSFPSRHGVDRPWPSGCDLGYKIRLIFPKAKTKRCCLCSPGIALAGLGRQSFVSLRRFALFCYGVEGLHATKTDSIDRKVLLLDDVSRDRNRTLLRRPALAELLPWRGRRLHAGLWTYRTAGSCAMCLRVRTALSFRQSGRVC
jgi:hypothetical protein